MKIKSVKMNNKKAVSSVTCGEIVEPIAPAAKKGARLKNKYKYQRGAMPIAQQQLYAIKTAHSRETLSEKNGSRECLRHG